MKNLLFPFFFSLLIFSSCKFTKSIKLYKKGIDKANSGQYEEAIEILQEGVLLDNNFKYKFHQAMAGCYFELKRYNSTLSELDVCIKNKDNLNSNELSDIYFLKGTTEGQLDFAELEIKSFKKSIFYNPENVGSYISLGYSLNKLENYQESINYLNKAIELDPESNYAYNNRGRAKIGVGNYKEAEEDLEKALSLDSNNPYIYFNKYEMYKALNNTEKACKMINKALKIEFDHVDFNNLKSKLLLISLQECNLMDQ